MMFYYGMPASRGLLTPKGSSKGDEMEKGIILVIYFPDLEQSNIYLW